MGLRWDFGGTSVGLRWDFGGTSVARSSQSDCLPPEVKSLNSVFGKSPMERVGQHSDESGGFSPGSPISSHRKVDSAG